MEGRKVKKVNLLMYFLSELANNNLVNVKQVEVDFLGETNRGSGFLLCIF